ncbi:hypothetical protein [Catenuloplanes japonicus]|uniref:hypothetical protein n=1 Tax=Catenuloplanes japonicus TaxID=33876 RepID=UPI000525F766|nr:hypothetical protein [Catenuloplanes japonicus]
MYVVDRGRVENPLGKDVLALPGQTVLGWFRQAWHEGAGDLDYLYGFDSIFEAVEEHGLPRPETVDELRELLLEHLWVEWQPESEEEFNPRLGEHALRVRSDDDEVDLAYYFLEDEVVAAMPERLAFLVHDTWPLPSGASDGSFTPGLHVRRLGPAGPGPETTYSVRLSPHEHHGTGTSLDLPGPLAFPGVALPDLAAHLRTAGGTGAWPLEARVLRALVAPDDPDMAAAAARWARYRFDLETPQDGYPASEVHAEAHAEIVGELREAAAPETLTAGSAHIVQVARYIDDFFGHDQWFLFDTRWAAAHPDLARSLLRYATDWDPFA